MYKLCQFYGRAIGNSSGFGFTVTYAKKENAAETYEGLKKDYKSLKAVLNSLGVNLTEIDEMKE